MTNLSAYVLIGRKQGHRLEGRWSNITWSGDTKEAARTVSIELYNTDDGRTKALDIPLGSLLRIYSDNTELFRGYIFKADTKENGSQTLTAYDSNVYLTKSSDSLIFRKMTATQIIRQLCSNFGVPVGELVETKTVLPKLVLRGKTLYEMIVIALTETRKISGNKYLLGNAQGKVTLRQVNDVPAKHRVNAKLNIISASFSDSIEDRKTQVKLTGGNEDEVKATSFVKNVQSIAKYGVMQHYENYSDIEQKAKLDALAKSLLQQMDVSKQEISVDVIGNIDFVAGSRVLVEEPMSGVAGLFYITADSHKFEADGTHTTSLTLQRAIELASEEYQETEETT